MGAFAYSYLGARMPTAYGCVIAIDYSDWVVPLAVAAVPALASILAAALSIRSARESRAAEVDAARLRELEARLAERKYDVYRPMIELLRSIMDSSANKAKNGEATQPEDFLERVSDFTTWLTIFGSDGALRAFHNFMQSAYHNPPSQVSLRLYAEFLLAARRDMGDAASTTTASELLGLRINDLYEKPEIRAVVELPFDELCERHEWQIPWKAKGS